MNILTKRIFSLALAAALSITVLAGCGGEKAPESVSAETTQANAVSTTVPSDDPYFVTGSPISFSFAAAGPAQWSGFPELQFVTELEKKTQVHIDWNLFPLEVANERVGVLMASSPRPDAFWAHNNFSRMQADIYGKQGLLIDLKPLIMEHAPHIKAAFDAIDGWKALDAGNGCIYALPAVDRGYPESSTVYSELIINTELLKEVGMEMPTTTEEYYEVLKAFKGLKTEDGREIIPFSYGPLYNYGDMLRGAFGIVDSTAGPAMMDGMYLQYDGNTVDTIADKDNYKEFIKYMNRLSTEGLMDPEVYTQDNNMFNAKGQAGQIASFVDWGGWGVVTQDKVEDGTYDVVPVLAGPDGTKLTQNRYTLNRNRCDFCITCDCKDPVSLIKWVDLFYNEDIEVGLEDVFGPRGVNWNYNDKGELEKVPTPDKYANYSEFLNAYTVSSGPYCLYEKSYSKIPISGTKQLKADLDQRGGYVDAAKYPVLPTLSFTDEETEQLTILRTDLMDYIKSFEASCITGQKDVEAEWDNHLTQLEKLGLSQLRDIYRAALDRYNAKG